MSNGPTDGRRDYSKGRRDSEMNRVHINRGIMDPEDWGIYSICYMQVCAVVDVTDQEILEACNRENPAGTENGWSRVIRSAKDVTEKTKIPIACADHPERLHFLVMC